MRFILGETEVTSRTTVPLEVLQFGLMFLIIYTTFMKKYNLSNSVLFGFIVWSMYGVMYTLNNSLKIPVTNILDLISKCFVGLGLWAYYTKILTI